MPSPLRGRGWLKNSPSPSGGRLGWGWLLAIAIAFFTTTATAAELRIGVSADVTPRDPHFVAAQPNLTVGQHIFDGLVRIDERGRVSPGLAVSWSTPDPLTWEIKLRQGVKFHDGSDLTLEDVVFPL